MTMYGRAAQQLPYIVRVVADRESPRHFRAYTSLAAVQLFPILVSAPAEAWENAVCFRTGQHFQALSAA
ncbi:MAG: hypothetical protein QM270_11930 [Bacillota bacterium]|nr:hypothetical protein [Bacillota bacterium]